MTDTPIDLTGARILAVDDVASNLDVLGAMLERAGFEVLAAMDGETAITLANREQPDLVLLDIAMPGIDGLECCRRLRADERTGHIPVIFLTARESVADVVEGLGIGAVDYITKPFAQEVVIARIRAHLKPARLLQALRRRNAQLEEAIAGREALDNRLAMVMPEEEKSWSTDPFIGDSPTVRAIVDRIALLENADAVSVLITGESGTGKELVARTLHARSPRAAGPFVAVNCAAIPLDIAETLLFGHAKGAFTGATHDQGGYFAMADGGTLFLDEVGEMPAPLQPKLLRALEEGTIRPLGSRREQAVDVRIVAATNAPVSALREDLYYRLARFTVHLPPLRERREDIPALARHFLGLFASELGMDPPPIAQEALHGLQQDALPGNVRELKNRMEQALIESRGEVITAAHLDSTHVPAREPQPPEDLPEPLSDNLMAAQRQLVERAVARSGGNISRAARALGVDRNKVYRILARPN